ncbi:hypothetical protein TI04_12245 [Achromatium sp. WMS2]|nr:hypothetical protein TI04_12245 [Achromatium sp. WMS2]
MLHVLTSLEETRAYKELVAKGEVRGEARGRQFGLIEGEVRGEARGRQFGLIEGEAKGEARGRKVGKTEGQLELLKRQITRKFGKLSTSTLEKLDAATPDQLGAWADGIFDAKSVEELLNG